LSYPILRAAFSRELPLPATGHAGAMSQPYWVSTGDQGYGFFIVGDESVLCAIDLEGRIFWQTTARLAFAGYAVDQRSVYVVDGYVLLGFDVGLIQKKLTSPVTEMLGDAERDPQRAYNLITLATCGVEKGDSPFGDIYKVVDASDIANAGKLAKARQRRSWLRMLREAKAEWLKNGERLHAINSAPISADYYDLLASRERQLAGFMDDARWLLDVDELNKDRSCQQLIARIEAEITQLESEAADLRFSAPVVRRNWQHNGIGVFTMSGNGLFMGFSTGFKEAIGSKQKQPAAMRIAIEEGADRRTVLTYLSGAGVTALLLDDKGLSVLPEPEKTAEQWNEKWIQSRSQLPWKQPSLPGRSTEFAVHRLDSSGAKGILVVSRDERADEEIIQLISYPATVPNTPPTPDFTREAPVIIGGKATHPTSAVSLPFIAPVIVNNENDSTFIYALSFSSFAPSPLLGMIDNTRSRVTEWEKFIGTDAVARGQKRESVRKGTLVPPTAIMRPVSFNKIKLQGNITDEDWILSWHDANLAFKTVNDEKTKLHQRQQENIERRATLDDILAKSGPPFIATIIDSTWQQLKDSAYLDKPELDEYCKELEKTFEKLGHKMQEGFVKDVFHRYRAIMQGEGAIVNAEANITNAEANFTSKSAAATSVISSSALWTVWRMAS